ncbi:MAG: Gfo/Idh/MocA family oxidoreductase [Herpetosiphon sp.]
MDIATLETFVTRVAHPSSPIRTIGIGLIGCGYWGPKLARNFDANQHAALTYVSDLSSARLAEIQDRHPDVAITCDYNELLASDAVDAVVIATPVRSHYRLCRDALLAGKHVLVEKPLTDRVDQGAELVAIAAERGLTLMVGHTFVYNPAVEAVRDIIRSGELGNIYYLNATRVNLGLLQRDINVMWDLGPHDISILQFILDADPIKVSATGSCYINKNNTGRPLYEVVYLNLVFPNDVMTNVRLSWLDPVKQRSLTVIGSKKMLVYDDIADDKVVIYDKGVEVPPHSVTEDQFHASYRHGAELTYPVSWSEPLAVECQHFLDCIRTGTAARSDAATALKVVKVLETAQQSLNNGGCELWIDY